MWVWSPRFKVERVFNGGGSFYTTTITTKMPLCEISYLWVRCRIWGCHWDTKWSALGPPCGPQCSVRPSLFGPQSRVGGGWSQRHSETSVSLNEDRNNGINIGSYKTKEALSDAHDGSRATALSRLHETAEKHPHRWYFDYYCHRTNANFSKRKKKYSMKSHICVSVPTTDGVLLLCMVAF